MSSLLPAQGYSDLKARGLQKGISYFDAKLGGSWFRVGIDSCTAVVVSKQREHEPA